MRCDCCNKRLNDYETTLKSTLTGEYMNTCVKCLDGLPIKTTGRPDLLQIKEVNEEVADNDYLVDDILTSDDIVNGDDVEY